MPPFITSNKVKIIKSDFEGCLPYNGPFSGTFFVGLGSPTTTTQIQIFRKQKYEREKSKTKQNQNSSLEISK